MNIDLSNQVLARLDNDAAVGSRRPLDLGNISTPELGLLSPRRSEIAPRGLGRDAALIAYSERLREGYRSNEGGIRDGMLKLGEAYRDGQEIAVSCFCRAGQICHADIVKNAIEKVGRSLLRNASQAQTLVSAEHSASKPRTNPRTERAVNDVLSVTKSDLTLSKLDDTEGRNRSEHASHLNGQSQFIRDLYERGSVVRNGVLITPRDNPSAAPPPAVTTVEYALKRLGAAVNESKAKELAPRIVEHGRAIAGTSADRDTQIKVFNWIYGALAGRYALLNSEEKVSEKNRRETKEERFDRTLSEIATLAQEMSRLEPSDRLVLLDDVEERFRPSDADRREEEIALESSYEPGSDHGEDRQPLDHGGPAGGVQEFDRMELANPALSRLAAEMSKDDLNKWIDVRLPVIDELIEGGTPVDAILKPFRNDIYHAAKESPSDKQAAIDDLRFASLYVEHQLKQPESNLRHTNSRYRRYAGMLENATSRGELMDAASRIRHENARVGIQWEALTKAEKAGTTGALTSREMQFLFTEASPRHYTSDMTALRLSYAVSGAAARSKTDALVRGEIAASKEATRLIQSLEARLERGHTADSLAATKHFLQSLSTPNDELRYKNEFDHNEAYRKLPPAERDYVYQRAVLQKDRLATGHPGAGLRAPDSSQEQARTQDAAAKIATTLRASVKGDLVELLTSDPGMSGRELGERASRLLERGVDTIAPKMSPAAAVVSWSRELGADMSKLLHAGAAHSRRADEQDREKPVAAATRSPMNQAHER